MKCQENGTLIRSIILISDMQIGRRHMKYLTFGD
jgi:hypothetical protein